MPIHLIVNATITDRELLAATTPRSGRPSRATT
jgi:hypothetical protein